MGIIAAALRELISLGVEGDALVAAIGRLEEADNPVRLDLQAERRREKDRDYRRAKRESERVGRHLTTSDDSDDKPPTQSEEQFFLSEPSENNQTLPPISPKISRKVVSLDFERFWEAYPRKVGKGATRTAYPKASRKADSQTILAGLERAKIGWRDLEVQFIPHPSTWLNQERWLDEPDDRATGPPKAVRDDAFAAKALEHFRKARALDG